MPFVGATRLKLVPLPTMTRPTGGGTTQVELPKAGILLGIKIPISVTLAGTLSGLNALGLASCIKKVTVRINAGHAIYDVSGAGYNYLLAEMIQDNYNLATYNDAKLVVATGTKNLDMFIPISENTRDEIGMIMLQNMQTFATLTIDWEADATVATGATITGTASPSLIIAEVPQSPDDMPDLSTIHQIVEEQAAIPSTADYDHNILIGATLVGQYYLLPSGFTRAQLRVQQSNVVYDVTPQQHRIWFTLLTSRDVNLSGTAITGSDKRLFWDFAGSDGLGQFGSVRDMINTEALTSIFSRITPVASQTLYSVRRQIVKLGQ